MKRLWISLCVLLLLLIGSFANIRYVTLVSNSLVTTLNQAEELAEGGAWSAADQLTRQAQKRWENQAPLLYVTLCHSNSDEVSAGLREVLELIQQEAEEEYSAANGKLIAQAEHLAEVEQLSLKNLL